MRPLTLACVALLLPALAASRTGPNPGGRALPQPIGIAAEPRLQPARSVPAPAPAAVATSFPVGLPAGAVQLDSTYYDLQDLGSLGTRIAAGADGRTHATWEDDFCELDAAGCPPNLNAPQPFPQRAMAYAYRTVDGTWTRIGKVQDPDIWGCCLTEHLGGFGTVALAAGGRVAISQHMDEDGCLSRGDFYLEDASGGSTWTAYLTPWTDPTVLFPQVVALPNGSFLTVGEVVRAIPSCIHCGVNGIRASRLAAAGATFVCQTGWQCGAWTDVVSMSMFRNGYSGFPALASATDGRAGVAVTDFGGNAWLIESADGTFNGGTITIRNLTNNSDSQITSADSTSTQYRPYINCGVAYQDTTPHVVWAELQARKIAGTIYYFDHGSRIRHWDSKEGLTVVRQVQPGEADSYDNVDNGYVGPIAGFNTISVDWPQVGFSPDGSETLVAWARFVDSEIDTSAHAGAPDLFSGVGYGDIACSVKRAGSPWSPQQDVTASPSTDDRYPAIPARNAAGRIQLLYQAAASSLGGVVQAQDRGTQSGALVRRIVYLERPLTASVLAVSGPASGSAGGLRVFPNPSRGRVRFSLGATAPGSAVLIYAVNGALVARVPAGAKGEVEWDGRDTAARPLASGVYLARVEGSRAATKLLFVR